MNELVGFSIGDRVTSKQTGLPMTGAVVGVMDGEYYRAWRTPDGCDWDRRFPGWTDKLVYFVIYDTPQRPISLEEFINQSPQWEKFNFTKSQYEALYEVSTPYSYSAVFPAEDLELYAD